MDAEAGVRTAGTLPASLGNLTSLKYAVLKFNNFTGAPAIAFATFGFSMPTAAMVVFGMP